MLLTFIKLPFVIKNFVLTILVAALHRFHCMYETLNIFSETNGKNGKQFGRNGQ